jgi:hypothetical protein
VFVGRKTKDLGILKLTLRVAVDTSPGAGFGNFNPKIKSGQNYLGETKPAKTMTSLLQPANTRTLSNTKK